MNTISRTSGDALNTNIGDHLTTKKHAIRPVHVAFFTAGALALTGCSALGIVAPKAPTPGPTIVAGIDPSTVTVQPEFKQTFGQQNAVPVATSGLRFLEVAVKDHPEFTVSTFKQTQENWDKDIAPKLKPIMVESLYKIEADKWLAGQQGIVLGAKTTDSEHTYTTPEGSVCHVADTPFEYSIGKPEVAGSGPATFSAPVGLTMHCKEGTSVTTTLKYDLELAKPGGSAPWQITSWHVAPVGAVTLK